MGPFWLGPTHEFPPVNLADPDGLLAIGGDLHPERVLHAYRHGIFPWFSDGQPILWWSPDPRMVLFSGELHVSRSMQKVLDKGPYTYRFNTAFEPVIRHCAEVPREGQDGTWITPQMINTYSDLHRRGFAQSAECWLGDELVGGLYGIRLPRMFCGESMFSLRPNASKFAFIHLVRQLQSEGVELIDAQVHTPHLESLGARLIPRSEFLGWL